MNTEKDFYQILGVSRDAPLLAIKAKYRELSARYHPDSSGGSADVDRFDDVVKAYKTLSNPKKRKAYDDEIRGGVVSNLRVTATKVVKKYFEEQLRG
jgi:DnaJ-class molecular chaperone